MAQSPAEDARAASVITTPEAVEVLREAVAVAGSQRAWAFAHGLSETDVSLTLSGRRPPPPGILRALNIKWALVRGGAA